MIADSHHPCRSAKPIDPRALDAVLFPPINKGGQMPFPFEPLSPHSTSKLARQADTGLAHHRAVPLDDFVAVLNGAPDVAVPAPAAAPVWDTAAAHQRKGTP